MLNLPLESTFNEFVKSVGGEFIEQMLPNNDGRHRADYLFRSPLIVAELKCLERELSMPDYVQKLQIRMNDWTRRGLIRIYGTTQIELRKLPKPCQDEWLEIHEAPIQKHILSDANRQIREAKESLGLPIAAGVVLLANEGQSFLSPADLFTVIARILKKKKRGGQLVYSSIQHVVVFSINMKIASAEFPQGMLAWFPAYRETQGDTTREFLIQLGTSWLEFCAAKRGDTHARVQLARTQIEAMQFIAPNPTSAQAARRNSG